MKLFEIFDLEVGLYSLAVFLIFKYAPFIFQHSKCICSLLRLKPMLLLFFYYSLFIFYFHSLYILFFICIIFYIYYFLYILLFIYIIFYIYYFLYILFVTRAHKLPLMSFDNNCHLYNNLYNIKNNNSKDVNNYYCYVLYIEIK